MFMDNGNMYMCARARVCVRVCVQGIVCAYVRACVCVCARLCACVRTCGGMCVRGLRVRSRAYVSLCVNLCLAIANLLIFA